jgi:hypothetical protein
MDHLIDVIDQMRMKLYDKGPFQPPQPRHVTPGNHRHYVMILTNCPQLGNIAVDGDKLPGHEMKSFGGNRRLP